MFKLIEKFFRSFVAQTPPQWQQAEEGTNEYMRDNEAIKENIYRSFGKGWFKRLECEDGWIEIIADCHSELLSLDPDYTIFQIKQKFGTLRYYAEPSQPQYSDRFREIIDKYEQLSSHICETTGAKGTLMKRGGWYKTIDPTLGRVLGYQEIRK